MREYWKPLALKDNAGREWFVAVPNGKEPQRTCWRMEGEKRQDLGEFAPVEWTLSMRQTAVLLKDGRLAVVWCGVREGQRGYGRSAVDAYNAKFHHRLDHESLQSELDTDPIRASVLRHVALQLLHDDDPRKIVSALAFLLVEGEQPDAAPVEPLLSHSVEQVRNAAATCRFELMRKKT